MRTTPEAPELHAVLAVMAERGLDTCVMEVSSHALAQHRVDGVVYDVALFTNLSQDHLDFHTRHGRLLRRQGRAVHPRAVTPRARVRRRRLGPGRSSERAGDPGADHRLGDRRRLAVLVDAADPSAFRLTAEGVDLHLRSSLPGDFNVTNTAMAAAALVLAR